MVGTSCIERAVVLSNLLFLYSPTHDCCIGCTTATLRRTVAVRTPSWLTDFLIPDGSRRTLQAHGVYKSVQQEKLWSGQVRNAFFQTFEAWHTALCFLTEFCPSIWLQHRLSMRLVDLLAPTPSMQTDCFIHAPHLLC